MKITTEYEKKPWPIRLYRWVVYRPKYSLLFCYWIVLWLILGAKLPDDQWPTSGKPIFPTRRSYVRHLWTVSRSMADYKMGNCFYLEDWIASLRQRPGLGP